MGPGPGYPAGTRPVFLDLANFKVQTSKYKVSSKYVVHFPLTLHFAVCTLNLRLISFLVLLAPLAAFAQAPYSVPRTPWGDPDLQGVWPATEFAGVPLERPVQFGSRNLLTDDELAAREMRERLQREAAERDGAGGLTGAPGHWTEWGKTQRQASLLVAPPDGRMPALTPAGQARDARQPRGTSGDGPLNGPADFTLWERCISRGVLGSTLPVLNNSGIEITQAPGVVAIRYEMVHDQRVIPLDGRRPLGAAIRQYMGASLGRWDGDTLVVVTTNFNGRTGAAANGGGVPTTPAMVLTERFRRVSHDTMQYEATVDDPATWVAPWTVSFPLRLTPGYELFEYACHEGNYGLADALRAARAAER
jgi:hypothetical protein